MEKITDEECYDEGQSQTHVHFGQLDDNDHTTPPVCCNYQSQARIKEVLIWNVNVDADIKLLSHLQHESETQTFHEEIRLKGFKLSHTKTTYMRMCKEM